MSAFPPKPPPPNETQRLAGLRREYMAAALTGILANPKTEELFTQNIIDLQNVVTTARQLAELAASEIRRSEKAES